MPFLKLFQMRDTSKQLRLSVFNCLSGNLGGVPVYDEKKKVSTTDSTFILLSTQQETPSDQNDCTWICRSSIDIEIIQKSGSEVSKDTIDDLSNTVLTLLLPTPGTTGLSPAYNLQFQNGFCESVISRNISLSETESILQKIVRFVVTIVQQNI